MPKPFFDQLVEKIRALGWYREKRADGKPGIPLELQIAGVLRHLARDWTSDDVSEAAGISEESHRSLISCFRELIYGWVHAPKALTSFKMRSNDKFAAAIGVSCSTERLACAMVKMGLLRATGPMT